MPVKLECPHCRETVTAPAKAVEVTCTHCVTKFDRAAATVIAAVPMVAHAAHDPAPVKTISPKAPPAPAQVATKPAPAPQLSGIAAKPTPTAVQPKPSPVAVVKAKEPEPEADSFDEGEDDEGGLFPSWVSVWGLAVGCVLLVAALCMSFRTARPWTLSLSGLGLAISAAGFVLANGKRAATDQTWLGICGFLSLLLLSLATFAPGMLNPVWGLMGAVAKPEPNKQYVVPREKGSDAGKLIGADGFADAVTEAIRVDSMVVRVDGVYPGVLPESKKKCLQVQFRLATIGDEVKFEGFGEKFKPVMQDGGGASLAFLEQRKSIPSSGGLVFGGPTFEGAVLRQGMGTNRHDFLLLFELPAKIEGLKLEIPAASWGGKGICRFQINKEFGTSFPKVQK